MAKKILTHKICTALDMASAKTHILVQIDCSYLRKVQIPALIHWISCRYVPTGELPVANPNTLSGFIIT